MKRNLTKLLSVGLLCLSFYAFGQQKPITGKVVDSNNYPVQDAYVYVEGTDNGVYTDSEGFYTIEAKKGDVIKVEFIGFDTKDVKVNDGNKYNVRLSKGKGGVVKLTDLVAVAYGSKSKEEIVGSVAVVDQDIINKQQATTVTSALQGSVPGVNIISSGGPGDAPSINIRGVGSINAGIAPLIIVDGVPYNGNLNSISQDQIESVSVLKDAGATALYGSRGANGVILITTKSGRKNMPIKVSFTSLFGISSMAQDLYQMVDAKDFMQLTWEAIKNGYAANPNYAGVNLGEKAADDLIGYLGYNPYNVDRPIDSDGNLVDGASLIWDTDWKNAILRDKAIRNDLRFSFEGGGERTSYFFSLDYLNQEGLIKTSNFKRYTSRLNLRSDLKEWLTAGVNTSFTKSETIYPNQSGNAYDSAMQWIYSMSNIYPIYMRDPKGNFIYDSNGNKRFDYGVGEPNVVNSFRDYFNNENVPGALYNNINSRERYDLNANGFLDIKLSKILSNKISLGYNAYVYDSKGFSNSEVGPAESVKGRATSDRRIQTTLNFNNALSFKKSIGNHNIGGEGIFEVYSYNYDYLGAQSTGFVPGTFVQSASTKPENVGGYLNIERMVSYLGRLSYDYNKKYFLEGAYRRDGSTKFSKETRWGDFYSIGTAWVVSNEEFFKNDYVNYLKLKFSYGELGNNSGIGYFPYISGNQAGVPQLGHVGLFPLSVVDKYLTWEKTASLNAGIEFGLFKNRISGTIAYYEKNSIDLIYDKPLPLSSGNEDVKTNVGSLSNYGVEVSLQSKNIKTPDFKWTSSINFSTDKNKITELTVDSYQYGNKKWKVGHSLYDFYMRTYAGVDSEDGYVMWYKDVKDASGNIIRETTKNYDEATEEYQGKSSLPSIIGGVSNSFSYKGFDLSFLFNFSFGSYVYDGQLASMQSFQKFGKQVSVDVLNRWQKPGDITDSPIITTEQNNFFAPSSKFLFKNDYVRLKAITFGYNLPSNITERIGMDLLRFYIQGDNIWTWQSHKGIDPEQSLSGNTDYRAINMKTLSLGIKLTF